MSKNTIEAQAFHSEAAAYAWVESILWPEGPVCPHCKGQDRIGRLQGKSTRDGVYKCYVCRKPFTVKVGTVFEDSHVPMRYWLQAMYLLCSSKKGISSNQLHRMLGVTLKTAWFMSHRIREAMRVVGVEPMGGAGETVEIDETLQGKQEGAPKRMGPGSGWQFRNVVFTLVQRGGSARSFHVDGTSIATLMPIIRANVNRESAIMTDEASWYKNMNKGGVFASHDTVNHTDGEYVRYASGYIAHTNSVEGYYSIFKRGMKGVYQHCKEKHLHRYLAEFDFRYSNRIRLGVDDVERTRRAFQGARGKRLTYRTPRNRETVWQEP
jgi:transposase-like protein